jgi:hypothetical protein
LLLQAPPDVVLLKVVVISWQTLAVPLMDATEGMGLTVMLVIALQPAVEVYVISVAPDAIPDTTPFVDPIVATEVATLVHVPPEVALESVIVEEAQTAGEPIIAATSLTVTILVTVTPVTV